MVRPDQVTVGVLVSEVPRDAVDDAVAVCGVREKRSDGKLPAHVAVYLTLGLCLFPEDDYEEVATKVNGLLGKRVVLHYREYRGIPGDCFGETDYFVDGVEVVAE